MYSYEDRVRAVELYIKLVSKLNIAGARIVGVRRRDDGPDVDDLDAQAQASGARMFFTQSLAHNPTGGSLTPGTAYGVLRVASARNLVVVEDDPLQTSWLIARRA